MIRDSEILKIIERQPKRSATYKQVLRELNLHGQERHQLGKHLRRMVDTGQLAEKAKDLFTFPEAIKARHSNLIPGRLSMHRDGFGFVTPEDAALKARLSGDVFIPPPAVGTAMHGDRVLIEMGSIRADGRAEGRVIKVAGRAHATVVGTFHYGDRSNYVHPVDEKMAQDIIIPRGMEVPPSAATPAGPSTPHRVIGKEAQRRDFTNLEGVIVDVEITDWPVAGHNPRGKVIEIIGFENDFGVDVEIIIRKHHLPNIFPPEVLAEAAAVSPVIPQREIARRHDFRHTPVVTIDGETARDFDDAVYVSRLPSSNYQLQVHIADVSHYVTEGSPLDLEARARGTSVYFPDRAVPMLPLELSTDICSLRPQVDRLVMSCVMEIDHAGEVLSYELSEGVIRSAERMTYTDIQKVLDGDAEARDKYAPLVPSFELMYELAQVLNRKRVRRGSIDFDLPEPIISFDELGLMQGVTKSERNWAHRLIEEFMLSANESVASYLEHNDVPSLYRIHEKPDARKVYDFETIAASFGYSLGVGPLPISRTQMKDDRSRDSRRRSGGGGGGGRNQRPIEVPQDVHLTPRMYQKLAARIAGTPEETILSYLMLRSLKQARYSEHNVGHFALAAPTYTHFTSPIRRYPDLIIHRILREVLRQEHAGDDRESRPRGRGTVAHSEAPSPWSKRVGKEAAPDANPRRAQGRHGKDRQPGAPQIGSHQRSDVPIPEDELHAIAESSSLTERRADEAERELMEWKKLRFMQDKIGEEFDGLIISVTKFGFFVELLDMFIEGLVPLDTLAGDIFTYRENTREIIGERSRKKYSMGDKVRVLLDRIDRMQRKLQFAVIEPPSNATDPRGDVGTDGARRETRGQGVSAKNAGSRREPSPSNRDAARSQHGSSRQESPAAGKHAVGKHAVDKDGAGEHPAGKHAAAKPAGGEEATALNNDRRGHVAATSGRPPKRRRRKRRGVE